MKCLFVTDWMQSYESKKTATLKKTSKILIDVDSELLNCIRIQRASNPFEVLSVWHMILLVAHKAKVRGWLMSSTGAPLDSVGLSKFITNDDVVVIERSIQELIRIGLVCEGEVEIEERIVKNTTSEQTTEPPAPVADRSIPDDPSNYVPRKPEIRSDPEAIESKNVFEKMLLKIFPNQRRFNCYEMQLIAQLVPVPQSEIDVIDWYYSIPEVEFKELTFRRKSARSLLEHWGEEVNKAYKFKEIAPAKKKSRIPSLISESDEMTEECIEWLDSHPIYKGFRFSNMMMMPYDIRNEYREYLKSKRQPK